MSEAIRPARANLGRLAIGTAPLGGLYAAVDTEGAIAALTTAAEGGVTHFDTAPHYGRGLAEERLGAFLARVDGAGRFTVSTKVGRDVRALPRRADDDIFVGAPPGESIFDFSPKAVRTQLESSRLRLGRERIDVAFIHDPDDHLDAALGAAEELTRLRDAGEIGAFGVGTNSAAVAAHLLDRVPLDAVLLAGRITLLEASGEPLAARCADAGVPLLAAGVFQSGILAGGQGDTYDYLPAPPSVRARVTTLREVCDAYGVALHTAAIGHTRRIRGVTTTLVGIRSAAEATAALTDIDARFPDGFWPAIDAVRATWQHGIGMKGAL